MGAARQDTSGEDSGAEAIAVLVEIMRSPTTNDAMRIDAIREIFDRGYGKPRSMDNMNDELDAPQEHLPVYQLVFLNGNENTTENKDLPPPPNSS